jgi:methylenetetrahydrofolate dehydrogenase (NADP+)/methenyltetrahydrofolate cyclohydrolase
VPCTPLGIRELLVRNGVRTAGANVVVLGRSVIVGKPMALLFALKGEGGDATVTICHSRSRDLAAHTRAADIIVAAMGVPRFLKADMVRDGAVVVDVGINRVDDATAPRGYRIVGDVDFDAVAPRCSLITPVPGGVGPMTVAMLMQNTLSAHRARREGHVAR